jgi:hypothetical protein
VDEFEMIHRKAALLVLCARLTRDPAIIDQAATTVEHLDPGALLDAYLDLCHVLAIQAYGDNAIAWARARLLELAAG